MTAANLLMTIEQGASYTRRIIWKDAANQPMDLSTYIGRLQIRDKPNGNLLLDLTHANGGISMTNLGVITIRITSDITQGLNFLNGFYDLLINVGLGQSIRLVEGRVIVKPGVTIQ